MSPGRAHGSCVCEATENVRKKRGIGTHLVLANEDKLLRRLQAGIQMHLAECQLGQTGAGAFAKLIAIYICHCGGAERSLFNLMGRGGGASTHGHTHREHLEHLRLIDAKGDRTPGKWNLHVTREPAKNKAWTAKQ